jgi:hypothetical protein
MKPIKQILTVLLFMAGLAALMGIVSTILLMLFRAFTVWL